MNNTSFRDRIKGLRKIHASDLVPHPMNWRRHPEAQREALRGVLSEVGIVDVPICRELPDGRLQLLDGHLRQEVLGDAEISVLVLDIADDTEAAKVLATLDPIAAMAEASTRELDQILRMVDTGSAAVQEMLAELAEDNKLYNVHEAEPPKLADGDREPFRQMTFTVHDDQHSTIERAITKAKKSGGSTSEVNQNTNGNALAFICEAYLDE